jgi:hypothetical protein
MPYTLEYIGERYLKLSIKKVIGCGISKFYPQVFSKAITLASVPQHSTTPVLRRVQQSNCLPPLNND